MSGVTDNYGLVLPAEGEPYSLPIFNGNFTQVDTVLKALSKLAKGTQYRQLVTAASGPHIDGIVVAIPSFTFKANRNYLIKWNFGYFGSGNSDSLFYLSINTCPVADANTSVNNLTVLDGKTKGLLTAYALQGAQHTGPIEAHYSPGALDQTFQVKFRILRVLGDDSMTIVGNAGEKASYEIIDMGEVAL